MLLCVVLTSLTPHVAHAAEFDREERYKQGNGTLDRSRRGYSFQYEMDPKSVQVRVVRVVRVVRGAETDEEKTGGRGCTRLGARETRRFLRCRVFS